MIMLQHMIYCKKIMPQDIIQALFGGHPMCLDYFQVGILFLQDIIFGYFILELEQCPFLVLCSLYEIVFTSTDFPRDNNNVGSLILL